MIAALAASALGAIWVSAAADFGPFGVIERLEQVKPKVLFSVEATVYAVPPITLLPVIKS